QNYTDRRLSINYRQRGQAYSHRFEDEKGRDVDSYG
ncbi:unnamed protein product, partial [marine sediment metagenome]